MARHKVGKRSKKHTKIVPEHMLGKTLHKRGGRKHVGKRHR